MTSLAQKPDPIVLSQEEIIEMYLAVIKIAAEQNLNRKRRASPSVSVSPELLKQLMDSQMKTKKCECCGCCGRSSGVMAVATHGVDHQRLLLLNPITH